MIEITMRNKFNNSTYSFTAEVEDSTCEVAEAIAYALVGISYSKNTVGEIGEHIAEMFGGDE